MRPREHPPIVLTKQLLFGVFVLLLCARAVSVSAQPIDLRIDRDPAVEDYDFSWVYWLETRGETYVFESLKQRPLPWDTPASRRWRGEVIAALKPMLDDADDRVRAAAVLALARIGHAPLTDYLLGSAELGRASLLRDESQAVRRAAWSGLGLMDTEATRMALRNDPLPTATEHDRAAQAMAIGLLQTQSKAHVQWLARRLDDPSESYEVKRWCVWSLGRLTPSVEVNQDFALNRALRGLPSTFVIGEVLMSPGFAQRNGGADLLIDVLRYHPEMRQWPGYVALSAMPADGRFGSTPRRLAMETRVAAALALADLPRPEERAERAQLLAHLKRRIVPGNSAQAMDFNRGFDLLAYAMHCDVEDEQMAFLYDQLRGWVRLAPDDPAVQEKLRERGDEGEPPRPEDLREVQLENEVRCYAALAAGLLIRRATEGTELHAQRPVEHDRAIEVERLKRRFGRRLMRAVADADEPQAYRAACAMGLGLSGDARYVEELTVELGKLRGGDEAVLGYGLLSLAMLGEDRAVGPPTRYVTRPGRVRGAGDRLGRRAALRAVGLIDWRKAAQADEVLVGAWKRDPWVGLHAAEASAWLGRYTAVPQMIGATRSESANWRLAGARSLGVLFDRSFPSRLSRLTGSLNPTLTLRPTDEQAGEAASGDDPTDDQPSGLDPARGWPMGSLHALGDPFVFEVLRTLEPEQAEQEEQDNPVPPTTPDPRQPIDRIETPTGPAD